jgi:hypothetical protein
MDNPGSKFISMTFKPTTLTKMQYLLFSPKGISLLFAAGFLDTVVLPQPIAFVAFTFFFFFDLLSGIMLARKKGVIKSSTARQKTFEKLLQYTVVISIGIGASSVSSFLPKGLGPYAPALRVIGDVLVWYCVAIEMLSNVENVIAISPDSPVSKALLIPIARKLKLKIDTFSDQLNKIDGAKPS